VHGSWLDTSFKSKASNAIMLIKIEKFRQKLKSPIPIWLLLVAALVVASTVAGAFVAVNILTRPDFQMKPDASSRTTW